MDLPKPGAATAGLCTRPMQPETPPPAQVQRLAAVSDGVFAVAMTLLVFNVHVPNGPLTDLQLTLELQRMLHECSGLLLSFAVAAMFWMSHFRLFRWLKQTDYPLALINFGLLFSIVLLPVSTSLRSAYAGSKIASFVFGVNLAFISGLNLLLWVYAIRKRWLPGFAPRMPAMLLDLAPSLYSLGLFLGSLAVIPWRPGAALALWNAAFAAPLVNRLFRGKPGARQQRANEP